MTTIFISWTCLFIVSATVSLCPTLVEAYPKSEQQFNPDSREQPHLRELTTEIILSLQRNSLSGQILTSREEISSWGRVDGGRVHEALIPSVVFAKSQQQQKPRINATLPSSRYSCPNYMHISAQHPEKYHFRRGRGRRRRDRRNEFDPNWKTVYSLSVGQAEFSRDSLPERLQFNDYFINFDLKRRSREDTAVGNNNNNDGKTGNGFDRDLRSVTVKSLNPNNVLWIQVQFHFSYPFKTNAGKSQERSRQEEFPPLPLVLNGGTQPREQSQTEGSSNGTELLVPSKKEEEEEENFPVFYLSCGDYCVQSELLENGASEQLPASDSLCVQSKNSRLSPNACILNGVAAKMSFAVFFAPGLQVGEEDGEGSSEIFKRNVLFKVASENLSRGNVYNSLVFLARKRFGSLDSAMKPFNVISWIAVGAVCAGAAMVFTLIKVLTLNSTDQTWYDYVVQQMLELMYDQERQTRKKFGKGDEEAGGDGDQASIRSGTSGTSEAAVAAEQSRGRASKAVLHGTIRIVSFVLVAIYEGKLYNSISFPKARFVSTFDDLLTNDKYAVKISREASDVNLYIGTRNYSMLNRLSESFNIEDCISWVEHSFSHGCIAYDFELRNLPKAQKVRMLHEENLFVKSKTSIMASIRHKPSTILNPAAQISRWILEAGIFQFWMVAENIFTESLISSKTTNAKRKIFSIKDYVGLFVVYSTLLLLAFLVFSGEVVLCWIRKQFQSASILEMLTFCWQKIKYYALRVRTCWNQLKSLFIARRKYCLKLKRIVNNIV